MIFDELVKKETATVRGHEFVFHEIGCNDWVNFVMVDEVAAENSIKDVAASNHDYMVRVVACSLAPGLEYSVEDLIEQLEGKPGELVSDLYAVADRVSGLSDKMKVVEGKGAPASDTPAA